MNDFMMSKYGLERLLYHVENKQEQMIQNTWRGHGN